MWNPNCVTGPPFCILTCLNFLAFHYIFAAHPPRDRVIYPLPPSLLCHVEVLTLPNSRIDVGNNDVNFHGFTMKIWIAKQRDFTSYMTKRKFWKLLTTVTWLYMYDSFLTLDQNKRTQTHPYIQWAVELIPHKL